MGAAGGAGIAAGVGVGLAVTGSNEANAGETDSITEAEAAAEEMATETTPVRHTYVHHEHTYNDPTPNVVPGSASIDPATWESGEAVMGTENEVVILDTVDNPATDNSIQSIEVLEVGTLDINGQDSQAALMNIDGTGVMVVDTSGDGYANLMAVDINQDQTFTDDEFSDVTGQGIAMQPLEEAYYTPGGNMESEYALNDEGPDYISEQNISDTLA